jgi:phage/plasmid-associated DNA primase
MELKNNNITDLIDIYTEKILNQKSHIICFTNGVYDLDKFVFLEEKPEDMSMTVGYDYQENHTEQFDDLLKFLEDIQPNKEERDYMLTYLSIGLMGNQLELFTILKGSGSNGKSVLIELLKTTFGNYFGLAQSQLFTRPPPVAYSPALGLSVLAKKRIVIVNDSEENNKLNNRFIKFITSRKSTMLQDLHNNMIEYNPNFVTLLPCNKIPDFDNFDDTLNKKLRIINFPTQFVMNPVKENQKKCDYNICNKYDQWKLDFMLFLIEYYKKYINTIKLKINDISKCIVEI